jgi:hypothetical protein
MQKRRKLSSNSTGGVIVLVLLFGVGIILISIFQDKTTIWVACLISLPFWGITFLIGLFYLTRDDVEYDGEFFYIYNWRKEPKNIIPIENISSMIWSRSIYRFFYVSTEGVKKHFFLFPNLGFSPWKLEKELKKANPNFFSGGIPFLGELQHVFFRDEDWYK